MQGNDPEKTPIPPVIDSPSRPYLKSIEESLKRFGDVPRTLVLKADLLRLGIRWEQQQVGVRHYHHHDEKSQAGHEHGAHHFQGSMYFDDGITFFVAFNPESPYALRPSGQPDRFELLCGHGADMEKIDEVAMSTIYPWTGMKTSDGAPMGTVFSPSLGGRCGPVAIFLLRYCEYTKYGEECRFCSWVQMGKSHEVRPNLTHLRETYEEIRRQQPEIGYLAMSGGGLLNRKKEADAYIVYLDALRQLNLPLPPTCAAIQAMEEDDIYRLRDAGFDYVAFNMEVWDKRAWPAVVPGKNRHVGRDHWMELSVKAAKIFGPGRVINNLVAGVEVADGLLTEQEGIHSTMEGFRWCLDHGIYPKYAIWIVKGGALYSNKQPPSLDYYLGIARERDAIMKRSTLPRPAIDCHRCATQSLEYDFEHIDGQAKKTAGS